MNFPRWPTRCFFSTAEKKVRDTTTKDWHVNFLRRLYFFSFAYIFLFPRRRTAPIGKCIIVFRLDRLQTKNRCSYIAFSDRLDGRTRRDSERGHFLTSFVGAAPFSHQSITTAAVISLAEAICLTEVQVSQLNYLPW